jgi:hydrogenase maturation protease
VSEVWRELERPGPETAVVGGVELRRGSRVRLRPRAGRDAWDTMLVGKDAVVESIEADVEGSLHVVVSLFDDMGRELGDARPGHRFFFAPDELEPLAESRVLVAGIGNVFLGDDGFGSALAAALADAPLPPGVEVRDYGIRGLDLAYALAGYDAAVLLDAVPLGEDPGTVAVIEPELEGGEEAEIETHGMDPARVLRLARELGALPRRIFVVGCEPQTVLPPDADDVLVELSEPVRAAVETASSVVRSLLEELVQELRKGGVQT